MMRQDAFDFYAWMLEDWRLFGMIPWHFGSYPVNEYANEIGADRMNLTRDAYVEIGQKLVYVRSVDISSDIGFDCHTPRAWVRSEPQSIHRGWPQAKIRHRCSDFPHGIGWPARCTNRDHRTAVPRGEGGIEGGYYPVVSSWCAVLARCRQRSCPRIAYGCFYGCFSVIEAQGGTWFRTPCPKSQRLLIGALVFPSSFPPNACMSEQRLQERPRLCREHHLDVSARRVPLLPGAQRDQHRGGAASVCRGPKLDG